MLVDNTLWDGDEARLVAICDGPTMTRKKDGEPPNWRRPPPLAFAPPIGYSPAR